MKILAAQLNPTVGAVADNVRAMLKAIEKARREGVNLIIFPELAVSGYPPKDLLYHPEFVEACLAANEKLKMASDSSLLVVWGNVAKNSSGIGKPLHNAGYVAWNGNIIAIACKNQLPTYDVFDEARYFEPGKTINSRKGESEGLKHAVPKFTCFGRHFALTVCEDLWSHDCFSPEEKGCITPVTYATKPLEALKKGEHTDILLNISASPYVAGKPSIRNLLLKRIAVAEQATIVYANQVGANDDLIFDGHSSITDLVGRQWVAPGFKESLEALSIDSLPESGSETNGKKTPLISRENELIEALTLGIRDYLNKTGFKKVFIGLSGGIDSSLTTVLAQKALGSENVTAVAMPGPYSSSHSLEDAEALAGNLGIELRIHSINRPFEAYIDLLSQGELLRDLAEQNLQARLRGVLLMTLANRENALVLATGNKSELATGYSTLYGDSCGALAPLGDLFKTEVYALSEAINSQSVIPLIPPRVLTKPPSAELAPNQLDSDALPPYPILDRIIKGILEEQLGVSDLLRLGYDKTYVYQTLQRIMYYEYKRQQMPPSLKVSRKAFGSGRVYPIVQRFSVLTATETSQT